jgi:hypothetical protein
MSTRLLRVVVRVCRSRGRVTAVRYLEPQVVLLVCMFEFFSSVSVRGGIRGSTFAVVGDHDLTHSVAADGFKQRRCPFLSATGEHLPLVPRCHWPAGHGVGTPVNRAEAAEQLCNGGLPCER